MSDGAAYLVTIVAVIVVWASRRAWKAFCRSLDDPPPPERYTEPDWEKLPPSARQMAFLESLRNDREAETWMMRRPRDAGQASEMIDALLKQPHREGK